MAVSRKFLDSSGVHWQVYELDAVDGRDAPTAGEGWLYFFSRGVTRSLAPYPDDWSQMDWAGLERLCHRAKPPMSRHPEMAGLTGGAPDAS